MIKYSKSWRRNLNATIRRDERKDSAKFKRKRESYGNEE